YTTTTRTTTVNQLFERFEDTMQGFDAEIGVLTPWLERYVALRWFAGYYNFNNSYGSDIGGLKGRAEIRFSQKLAIDATYYADEEITGSNWLFGIRMTIPIFMENLADGRSPFQGSFSGMFDGVNMSNRNRESAILRGGSASTYPSSYALSPFAAMAPTPSFASASRKGSTVRDRMTEQTLRLSSGARTSQSGFIEDPNKRKVSTETKTKTRVVVIDDSIVFVDNLRGTLGGPGTFENPLSGIQGGVNRASTLFGNRGDVFVTGRGTTYTENVVDAGSSVKIWGGGRGLPANGGRRFTNGSQPVLNGGFQVANIPQFSLSGFSIVNGFAGGIGVSTADVANVTLDANTIAGTGAEGVRLFFDSLNNAAFSVTNNVLSNNASDGLEIAIDANLTDPGYVAGTISGNTFMGNGANGFSVQVDSDVGSVIDLGIRNNVSSGNANNGGQLDINSSGDVGDPNNPVINVMISGNQFTGNIEGFDLQVDSDNNAVQNIVAQGNNFSGNTSNGFRLVADMDDAMFSATFISNAFLNNGSRGLDINIDADGEDTAEFGIKLVGNRFESNQSDGFRLDLRADDGDIVTVDFEATGNTFLNNLGRGADVHLSFDGIDDDLVVNGIFSNNIVSGNTGDGLNLRIDSDDIDTASGSFDMSGNQFLSNGGDSIAISVDLDGDDVTFSSTLDNISTGAGGFSLRDNGTSDANGFILLNGAIINFPNPGDVP
ncbi:MAG: right-handed parallel beta-helix repeat-containing protein, partial [Verrucomicrobiota bacterium]